jgi:dipeptidyl aminopeptidase/acylaminoacyl peptidase
VLLGTSGDEKEWEGDVGGNLDEPSRVQAIVDLYGPVDFILRSKDQPQFTNEPSGKVYQLLGQAVNKNEALAKQASGAFHVTADDPPLLAIHGTADKTVLPNQSQRICAAYRSAGLKPEFHSVDGAAHGGPGFSTPECQGWVLEFLKGVLKR